MDRVRERIGTRACCGSWKAFLKAGILTEQGGLSDSVTGMPQGGILSPLLSNIALTALDRHYAEAWRRMGANSGQRQTRREKTRVTHIGEGFDFLGFTVKRSRGRHGQAVIHTIPPGARFRASRMRSGGSPAATTNRRSTSSLHRLKPVLRCWRAYFRHGVSKHTFNYLRAFHLAAGRPLAATQAPQGELVLAPAPLPRRVVADRRGARALQPRRRGG